MTTTHFHHFYGRPGYLPEGDRPGAITTLMCLAGSVSHDLGSSLDDLWHEYEVHRDEAAGWDAQGERPGMVAELRGYAIQAVDMIRDIDHIRDMISPSIITHWGRTGRAEAHLRDILLTQHPQIPVSTRGLMLMITECSEWRCLLSEHDAGYVVPLASKDGGYVYCVCRTCVEVVVWSPDDGTAPYCDDCEYADCAHRERVECGCGDCDDRDE